MAQRSALRRQHRTRRARTYTIRNKSVIVDEQPMEILLRALGFMAHIQFGREAEPEDDDEATPSGDVVDVTSESQLAEPAAGPTTSGFQRSRTRAP